MRDRKVRTRHYDCVGIGVGPANLSLASLIYEHSGISNLFLDRKPAFSWHDGQQLPGTTLQVSMFKDLVSLANPTNRFSFLSYLHASGKLYHFINAQFDAVSRQEFRNYMEWASARNENVVFGERVLSVDFDGDFVVHTNKRTVTAHNLSIGVGRKQWVPDFATLGERQFHVGDILVKGQDLGGKRVCVVGGGQSGAEVFLDLITRPVADRPRRVFWVTRRRNYFPIDDSPFTNDFFMPGYSDYFFDLDRETRERFNTRFVLASDGISEATLREIYQRIYTLRFIEGVPDLVALHPNCEVFGIASGSGVDDWAIKMSSSDHPGVVGQIDADIIVWATGFQPAAMDFLEPIAHRFEREGDEIKVDRDFAARWDGPADRNVFLHNAAPQQRGLADRNLSLIAWRSQRVIDRLRGVRGDEQRPSFIEWSVKSCSDRADHEADEAEVMTA